MLMNKTALFLGFGVVLTLIVLIIALNNDKGVRGIDGYAITNKETAIQIGRELLAEHFDDTCFLDPEFPIDAEIKSGIWKVYTSHKELGLYHVFYVTFRKNDGEVLKIGTE